MSVILTSSGFIEPNYIPVSVTKENIEKLDLKEAESLDNLIIHRCFHLISHEKVVELLKTYYDKLKSGGKLTIYCIDVYQLCHKVHRREITEGEFNNIMYENGQVNSISTLFFLGNCDKLGFKRDGVTLNGIYAKLEFVK